MEANRAQPCEPLENKIITIVNRIRELEIQRLAHILNQVIEKTRQHRLKQKRIDAKISVFNKQNPSEQNQPIISKLECRRNQLALLIDDLENTFERTLEQYEKQERPRKDILKIIKDEAVNFMYTLIPWNSTEEGFIHPSTFRTKWEIAKLGYQWEDAYKQFNGIGFTDSISAIQELVMDFCIFAKDHPSVAKCIARDVALIISCMKGESFLETFQKGVSASLVVHTLLDKVGHFSEPPLTEKDLKWIFLKDFLKFGHKVIACIEAAAANLATGLHEKGLLGAIFKTVTAGAIAKAQAEFMQKKIESISTDHLASVEDLIKLLRGVHLEDILAGKQRLLLIKSASHAVQLLNNPKNYFEHVCASFRWQITLFKHASSTEKKVRILALIVIPLVGALFVIQAGLSPFLVLSSLVVVIPSFCALVNSYYSQSVQTVREKENLEWVKKNFKGVIEKNHEEILAELCKTDRDLNTESTISSLDNLKQQEVQRCLERIVKELDEKYHTQCELVGQLQINEVLHIYSRKDFKNAVDLLTGWDEKSKEEVRKWIRSQVVKTWLKEKLYLACEHEFTIMLTHYNSPEAYKISKARREKKPIPIRVGEVEAQMENAEESVSSAVRRIPLFQHHDLVTKVTENLFKVGQPTAV